MKFFSYVCDLLRSWYIIITFPLADILILYKTPYSQKSWPGLCESVLFSDRNETRNWTEVTVHNNLKLALYLDAVEFAPAGQRTM